MIRAEAWDKLSRLREFFVAAGVAAFGLWLCLLGGLLFLPLGITALALAAGLTLIALRRRRFAQGAAGPGIVELDEAQVGWLGPEGGGFLSLRELAELRLLSRGSRRFWRLKQGDGQALLIPVDAQGADRLFDVFTALPGMDSEALVTALDAVLLAEGDTLGPVIWRHPDRRIRIGAA